MPKYEMATHGVSEGSGSSTDDCRPEQSWKCLPVLKDVGSRQPLMSHLFRLRLNMIHTVIIRRESLWEPFSFSPPDCHFLQSYRMSLKGLQRSVLQPAGKQIWVCSTTVGWVSWYSSAGLLSFLSLGFELARVCVYASCPFFLWDTLPPCGIKL